ncbi:putative SAM-dependent methyltransferase (plasmid) [Mesomycoplasma conjunctivae]|nr:putative SAM-dependent methyltransferase [Mesomycoplasma conjunctivae]
MALISDAGMPLVSDPGFELIKQAREKNIELELFQESMQLLVLLLLVD